MSDHDRLERLREEIVAVDEKLIELLGKRYHLVEAIGRIKRSLGVPVLDPEREAEVVRRAAATARERDIDAELVRDVFWRIIDHARGIQDEPGD